MIHNPDGLDYAHAAYLFATGNRTRLPFMQDYKRCFADFNEVQLKMAELYMSECNKERDYPLGAVMNNDQIVASVSAGVYRANSEQNSLLRQQNQLLQAILQKETGISTRDVFNAVQSENRRYYARTGKNALVY